MKKKKKSEVRAGDSADAKTEHIRVKVMSTLSDSGFEEELQSPSPSHPHFTRPWSGSSGDRRTPDRLHSDYDESCFLIQRNNQENFVARDCLARQPQVTLQNFNQDNLDATSETNTRLKSWRQQSVHSPVHWSIRPGQEHQIRHAILSKLSQWSERCTKAMPVLDQYSSLYCHCYFTVMSCDCRIPVVLQCMETSTIIITPETVLQLEKTKKIRIETVYYTE